MGSFEILCGFLSRRFTLSEEARPTITPIFFVMWQIHTELIQFEQSDISADVPNIIPRHCGIYGSTKSLGYRLHLPKKWKPQKQMFLWYPFAYTKKVTKNFQKCL